MATPKDIEKAWDKPTSLMGIPSGKPINKGFESYSYAPKNNTKSNWDANINKLKDVDFQPGVDPKSFQLTDSYGIETPINPSLETPVSTPGLDEETEIV